MMDTEYLKNVFQILERVYFLQMWNLIHTPN